MPMAPVLSRISVLAILMGTSLPAYAADYYMADTGRTARTEVTTQALSAVGQPVNDHSHHGHDHGHHHHHDHDHDHDEFDSSQVMELTLKQVYSPELEEAIIASGIDSVAIQNEGIEKTLRTFAEIQANAITGKSHYMKMDPVYFVLGMIYQNTTWARVPMIPVENAELAEAFGLDPGNHNRVSSVWVMQNPKARMLVMSKLQGMESRAEAELSESAAKALNTFAFRMGTFLNLPGELKMVPLAGKPDVWLSPLHLNRPEVLAGVNADFVRDLTALDKTAQPYKAMLDLDRVLVDFYNSNNTEALAAETDKFLAVADSTPGYMTELKRKADLWQTNFNPFKRSSQFFMYAFFAFLAYLLILRHKTKKTQGQGGPDDQAPELVDGRAEEYSARPSEGTAPIATALQGLNPASNLAMAGGPSDGAVFGSTGGFAGPVSGQPFDNTGASNYGDPISAAAVEVPRGNRFIWSIGFGFMLLATLTLIAALLNRAYLGGRMPVSNMYESITFAMGGFALVALIYEGIYRRAWLGIGASFAGWTLMLMANSMSLQARKIDPLVAVLNSVWLNWHVTTLLISYSCFLMGFVCGVLYLFKDMTGNRAGVLPRAETFEYLNYRMVQIGWPLLTVGIFLGAVWANTAWGSFWSWDPKETWALITWLTYTIYLHLRINLGWNGRRSIYASMIGFVMVLLTYFGVSYLPGLAGGMHSYAEPIKR